MITISDQSVLLITSLPQFASAVYIVAWDHLIIQHFMLALNRFIIILRAYYTPTAQGESYAEVWLFNVRILTQLYGYPSS